MLEIQRQKIRSFKKEKLFKLVGCYYDKQGGQEFIRRFSNAYNNIQQHNDTQQNDTKQNDIKQNDIKQNDIKQNDNKHNGTKQNGILHNDTEYDATKHNDTLYYIKFMKTHNNIQHNENQHMILCIMTLHNDTNYSGTQ